MVMPFFRSFRWKTRALKKVLLDEGERKINTRPNVGHLVSEVFLGPLRRNRSTAKVWLPFLPISYAPIKRPKKLAEIINLKRATRCEACSHVPKHRSPLIGSSICSASTVCLRAPMPFIKLTYSVHMRPWSALCSFRFGCRSRTAKTIYSFSRHLRSGLIEQKLSFPQFSLIAPLFTMKA